MQTDQDTLYFAATDLANHLACRHLTQLSRRVADGELKRPYRDDPVLETLIERGREHEREYVQYLQAEGNSVVDLRLGSDRVDRTLEAMRSGHDVIVQPELRDGHWGGYADLFLKVDTPSQLGDWSYEVADTKLARSTRGGTILQLCLYSDLLASVQGITPKRMAVVKPGEPFEVEHYRVADFLAYYRLIKRDLQQAATATEHTYPDPVTHCEICRWWSVCEKKRREDDHLSFIAGIQKHQTVELTEQGLGTLELFATSASPLKTPPRRGSQDTYDRVHRQAKLQHEAREQDTRLWEYLPPEQKRGLWILPEPDSADVFFDIEGARHAPGGGLEYLLGYVVSDETADPLYKYHWAITRAEERAAFEEFIDWIMGRWESHPGMHIYHYAHYEPTAMKSLAMRHATREDEVDRLLRAERFVDLYAVVRQGLIASVESYSIKRLEPFYGYDRQAELADARHALHRFERAINLGLQDEILETDRDIVRDYNEDDCQSTLKLRDWLEELRQQQIDSGISIPRPELLDGAASESAQDRNDEVSRMVKRLLKGLPDEDRSDHQQARWLLAHLLEYFRREDKCVWWEYFRMHGLESDEMFVERSGLAGLTFQEEVPKASRTKLPTHRYRFPTQEADIRAGKAIVEVGGEPVGSVVHFDLGNRIIDIKKRGDAIDVHPANIFLFELIRPDPMPESLLTFAKSVVSAGIDRPLQNARYTLLAQQLPRFHSLTLPLTGEVVDTAIKLALDMDSTVLPVQGPPGAGKTYLGSHMISALAKEGKRVGVTAVSHKVITHLLEAVETRSPGIIDLAQKPKKGLGKLPESIRALKTVDDAVTAVDEGAVVGGTAWLWSNASMEDRLDYLFIDEAGQMSLAMALAAGRAAKNIVLLGDPQQLEQPQQGTHPEGAEIAVLSHLLRGHHTIEDDRGLFLSDTWRLHPEICRFTSEQYYDGRLSSRPGLECQIVRGPAGTSESGLSFVPVHHTGNQNQSCEEVDAVCGIYDQLLDGTHTWFNQDNHEASLTVEDILVVAPYNAQVTLLEAALPDRARIGTVDKFQGQEAAIVIYSITSSSAEDAPRGLSFLYSPNRLNVATSRARCLCILVGSPAVFAPECSTPQQMQLANGLCRYLELAGVWEPGVER